MDRATQYPHHLAKLVAERLRADGGRAPPETVLASLFETLYLASLKTEERRRILCTVNYLDPAGAERPSLPDAPADHWILARFERTLPLDARTLRKLGMAADPAVSSLAVFSDSKRSLFLWGMVDQEPRYGDSIALGDPAAAQRPGLFQASITGPGNIAVYSGGALLGSLVQNTLVEQVHDVFWSGPIHAILKENARAWLARQAPWGVARSGQSPPGGADGFPPSDSALPDSALPDGDAEESELVLRWVNSVCRILVKVRGDRHGGGLVIVPHDVPEGLCVNYPLRYDRLPKALWGLVRGRVRGHRARTGEQVALALGELDRRKSEVLGAIRFIASLCRVDGVVLLDSGLGVHGFGVEIRVDNPLGNVYVAGDARATANRLRRTDLTQFGTRHRAIIRYCHEHPRALGFAVSRDGEIRAVTRLDDKLVLWDNVDVQLAFLTETDAGPGRKPIHVLRRFTPWED